MKNHNFRIINVKEAVMEVFELTGFSSIFDIEKTGEVRSDDIKVFFLT